MKKSLLIGLAAVALGGMTACSNILEEEGIVSPSAKTGTLTIALETDGSLDVATKSTTSKVTLTEEQMKDFIVKVDEKTLTNPSYNDNKLTYSENLAVGSYDVSATYGNMNANFGWNSPIFKGEATVVIETLKRTTCDLTAKLDNSQITVDQTSFNAFLTKANVTSLYVYAGENEPTDESGIYNLITSQNVLETKTLYVKRGLSNVYIVIKGSLKDDSKTFELSESISNVTEAAKNYNVKYSIKGDKGSLSLVISIDGDITEVPINAEVDPYTPATNS